MRYSHACVIFLAVILTCTLLLLQSSAQTSQPAETREELLSRSNKILNEISARTASGQLEQARKLAQELVTITSRLGGSDSLLAAGTLLNLASIELLLQDYPAAEATARRALQIYDIHVAARQPTLEKTGVAQALDFLGLALKGQAHFGVARVILEEALHIYEQTLGPNHVLVGATLVEIGDILDWLGDYDAARQRYQRALQIVRHTTTQPFAAQSLHRLAILLWGVGNHQGAKEVLELATEAAKQSNLGESAVMADALFLLSVILNDLGDQAGAQLFAERSLRTTEQLRGPDHPDVAVILTQLGEVLYRKGDIAAASLVLERATRINLSYTKTFPKGKAPIHVLLANARHLGVVALVRKAAGQSESARETLQTALKTYELMAPEHPDAGLVSGRLAVLLREAGDLQGAWSHFERALDIFRRRFGSNHWYVAEALLGMATVRWFQGDVRSAAQLFLEAKRIHEGNFDRLFVGMSQRQRLLALDTYRYLLDAMLTLPPSVMDVAPAYVEVLRWKNIAFQAALAERPSVEARTERLTALYEQYTAARRELAALVLSAPLRDNPDAQTLAVGRRTQEIERIEQDLSRENPAFLKEVERRHASPAEVCTALPPDSALIDYVRFERYEAPQPGNTSLKTTSNYTVFLLRAGQCSDPPLRIDLGTADAIEQAVKDLRVALKIGLAGMTPAPSAQEQAGRLAALMFPVALRQAVQDKPRLVISPDGIVALVPFALLPGDEGHEFLLETRTISYVPSGPDLLRLAVAPSATAPPQLLAVGDPDFSGTPGTTASLRGTRAPCATDETVIFDALPGTKREVADIGQLLAGLMVSPPEVLTGPEATKARLAAAIPGKTVLHLATHAYFAGAKCQAVGQAHPDRSPFGSERTRFFAEDPLLLSGLALTGANQNPEQGILTALEVATLDLTHVDLVVLSACDTGLGKLNPGQELLGLRWAFSYAGARNLVTSLWQVPDVPTVALMARFYQGLWQGKLGPAAALKEAQLARLHANRAAGDSRPWEWGAFTVSGPAQ